MGVSRWKGILALVAAGMLFMLSACGGGDDSDTTTAATSEQAETVAEETTEVPAEFESVVLGVVNDMSAAPLFVASERGFFPENGLDVKLRIFSSGADMNKALQAGNIQFATASTTSVPSSRSSGLMTSLVSGGMNDATSAINSDPMSIIATKDSGITPGDPQSIKGKKVAFLSGSTSEAYLQAFLSANDMTLDDIEAVNLEVPDHPVALVQGDVDAAVSWEPYASQSVRELGDNAVEFVRGEPLLGYIIGVGATDDTLAEAPETLKKFVAAVAQATQFIRNNPEEAAQIVANFIDGLNLEDATTAIRDHVSYDPRISGCTKEAFEVTAKRMADGGMIKKAPPVEEMVNSQFIDEVEAEHPEWFEDLPEIPAECQE
jgi:ABC-type nitrate/sulfonate/bicarbonate transport system substrate-binding protein